MKRAALVTYLCALGATLIFALVAMGIDAPQAPKTYLLMNGHSFGIGEQQVYAIDRSAEIVVRYRDEFGSVRTKSFHHHARASVAFTIEGVSSTGRAVLAISTANAAPPSSQTPGALNGAVSPLPSPELDERGALATAGSIADVAPVSLILSTVNDEVLSAGKAWKSNGEVDLPFAKISAHMDNVATAPNGQAGSPVAQIQSSGTANVRGAIPVNGFGKAALRGAGGASGVAFIDTQNRLLLGMTFATTSRGNALVQNKRGSYELKMQLSIKLVHYVPGIPPVIVGPGYVIASGYVGSYASPDTGQYSTAPPNPIAIPAATNTEYTGSPLPTYIPSALPEASLPPIPLPLASDQPIASAPPGPSPTPTPTRY